MPADGLVKLKATAVAAVAPATAEAAMNQPDNTSRPRPDTAVTMASSRPNAIFRRSGWAKRRMVGSGLSDPAITRPPPGRGPGPRSEEHTSELQSLMRISYAVFCLKKKKLQHTISHKQTIQI